MAAPVPDLPVIPPIHQLADEGYDDLPVRNRNLTFDIEDNVKPNEFIKAEIKKVTRDTLISGPDQIQIETKFEKTAGDGDVKIYLFNNQGVIQYYFIKKTEVTLQVPGQDGVVRPITLSFSKKIYTNVEPPKSFNAKLHKEKASIALMSASIFSEVETDALRHDMKLPTTLKHQVDEKIRNDVVKKGFLAVELFTGRDMVKGNQAPGLIERFKGKHAETNLKGRVITHARIASLEKKDKKTDGQEQEKAPKVKYHVIDLQESLKNYVGKSKFQLQMNENAPSYLREIANIHNAATLNHEFEEIITGPDLSSDELYVQLSDREKNERVLEILKDHKINKNIYWSLMNSENDRLNSELNRQYALLSRLDFLEELIGEFDSTKIDSLSPKLKAALYPQKTGKLEKLKSVFSKEKFVPLQLMRKIQYLSNSDEFKGADKETLEQLNGYCTHIEEKMTDLQLEMQKNESYLQLIANLNGAKVTKRASQWNEIITSMHLTFDDDGPIFEMY